jgi:hypothetical protein
MITPFRSLILNSARQPQLSPEKIRLIYSDDNYEYCYQEQFDVTPIPPAKKTSGFREASR